MKKHLVILIAFLAITTAKAQDFTTLTYFVNDSTKLELDLFLPKTRSKEKLPLLIHVHGGGFSGGNRTNGHILARHVASQGYAAASITYTLYMKGKKFSCDGKLTEKVKAFQIAANQLWQATIFFIKNAEKYNIDPAKIFISGSSAGAETALHAAFWDRTAMALYPEKLPENFKYAGLISGSGAIMDLNLITKKNLVPIMLFHGSCDVTVPYATASHHYCPPGSPGWLMLFGSYSIYNHCVGLGGSAHLYTFCGGGHEYSDELFSKQPKEVTTFMADVLVKKSFTEHTPIKTGKVCAKSEYNFCE